MPNKIKVFDAASQSILEVEPVEKSDAEWKKILTPEQFRIMRQRGTEPPGRCSFPVAEKAGVFRCAGCGTDLFWAKTKFESGTGWPSFWEPVSPLNILLRPDRWGGMARTEVVCARCKAHLGHVFDDGPPPTGKRYCINGVALRFAELPGPPKDKE